MKRLLLLLFTCLPTFLFADIITIEQAQNIALKFFNNSGQTRSGNAQIQMVWDGEDGKTRNNQEPTFYVFNRTDYPGFVIVSGDDVAMPIIGYSLKNSFKTEGMPSNIKSWFQGIREEINYARQSGTKAATTRNTEVGNVEVQLETALWNQEAPYNDLCPEFETGKTVTGCVATAVAIVMRYHQWPEKGIGTLPGYTYNDYNKISRTIPDQPLGHTYEWDKLPLSHIKSDASEETKQAIAQLMYDCGVMSEMAFNTAKNGGSGTTSEKALSGLINYMQYSTSAYIQYRQFYPADAWHEKIKKDIREVGPVLYGGSNSKEEGHQFILDGYTDNNYFGVNWGWSGSCNGYYLLSALEPNDQGVGGNSGGGFSENQSAILGLKKAEDGDKANEVILYFSGTSSSGDRTFNGLTSDTDNYQENVPFKIQFGFIGNFGINNFNGKVSLALYDKDNNFKQFITNERMVITNLEPYTGTGYYDIPCIITEKIQTEDYIAGVYKSDLDESDKWNIIYGSEELVWKIIVKEREKTLEEQTSFYYNRTERIIKLNTYINVNYVLSDSNGSQILSGTTEESTEISIDTKTLQAGSYTLEMSKGEDSISIKFIIGNKEK